VLFPQCERPSFTTIQTAGKIVILYILIFMFSEVDRKIKDSELYSSRRAPN
jgi:hypothetical protein